jgi:hypothetical protein
MNIFVSYSPEDSELVAAIISTLCASNRALDYCDAGSLRARGRWREELAGAITEARVVLVFWCHHSNTSYEVRKEFAIALEQGKDVLPLLLDGTPLPGRLAGGRCIDFRSRVGAIHVGSGEGESAGDLAGRVEADRLIASGLSRQYEELLIMSLTREIEAELASMLRPK